jgi:transketolase
MTGFGASGPGEQLYEHFGITPAAVAATARQALGRTDLLTWRTGN